MQYYIDQLLIYLLFFFFGHTMQHLGSQFPDQELNQYPCMGSRELQPLHHRESPCFIFLLECTFLKTFLKISKDSHFFLEIIFECYYFFLCFLLPYICFVYPGSLHHFQLFVKFNINLLLMFSLYFICLCNSCILSFNLWI